MYSFFSPWSPLLTLSPPPSCYLKVRSGDPRGRRFVDGRHVLGRRRCLVADCFEYSVERESLQQKLNLPEHLYLQAKTISLQLSLTWVICKDNHLYLFKSGWQAMNPLILHAPPMLLRCWVREVAGVIDPSWMHFFYLTQSSIRSLVGEDSWTGDMSLVARDL